MNNSVFGKTLENIINRFDIRLISSDDEAQKLAAKPNFDCCTIFDENLIAFHMKKTKLYLKTQSILVWALSTWVNPWCITFITTINYINTKYGDNAQLLFTDTDSLAYEIKTKYFYKDINRQCLETV